MPSGIRIERHQEASSACLSLAAEIGGMIRGATAEGRKLVLGLATGSTPMPLYEALIRLQQQEGLSFADVVTFNLDEYCGIPPEHPQSYHEYMRSNFFSKVDLPRAQTHLPDGMVSRAEVASSCAAYESLIDAHGGIDLQILGIGRSGHIGFNEPPSAIDSRTRLVKLDPVTRQDAAEAFSGIGSVPTEAITMGVSSILKARRIVLLAWGQSKAEIVARTLRQTPNPDLPATFLQTHPDVTFLLDQAAASKLESDEA